MLRHPFLTTLLLQKHKIKGSSLIVYRLYTLQYIFVTTVNFAINWADFGKIFYPNEGY